MILLILLTFHLALTITTFPPDTCLVEGQACEAGQDNLLNVIPGIESMDECKALCVDSYDCQFVTHFGAESFPLQNYCNLYRNCTTLIECQDCRTEVELCFEKCGESLEGSLNENVLEVIHDVNNELVCKSHCRSHSGCEAYTYHNSSDHLLLPSLQN